MASTNSRKIGFALLMIFLGALFLFDNLDLYDLHIPYYFTKWYTFLFLVGLFLLLVREKSGPGITLLIIGAVFFTADVIDVRIWSLWPVALIAVGIAILFRRRNVPDTPNTGAHPMDTIDEVAIFGGVERTVHSQKFKGGKLSAIFGGVEVDLSKAKLEPGDHVIDLFVLFGGGTIYVNPEMNVEVRVTSIFGGYSDERGGINLEDEGSKLIITGTVLFGGGEVKLRARS